MHSSIQRLKIHTNYKIENHTNKCIMAVDILKVAMESVFIMRYIYVAHTCRHDGTHHIYVVQRMNFQYIEKKSNNISCGQGLSQ